MRVEIDTRDIVKLIYIFANEAKYCIDEKELLEEVEAYIEYTPEDSDFVGDINIVEF